MSPYLLSDRYGVAAAGIYEAISWRRKRGCWWTPSTAARPSLIIDLAASTS
ncbi:hypothetical protein [Rhizobium hidalgonense]|uniref:hypothetical protein n=1 Tax=Rhizobium hidalgonense TaxID=1538159 RepID=UPI0028717954|nr:hypothetical protein [Rhizobium hidalgonense]MDR9812866.1 hypothetical protein [Rhizobium hidalgonense]